MLSPYHFAISEAEEASMRALERQLVQPGLPRDGLSFHAVAETLERAELMPLAQKRSLVAGLVDQAAQHNSNPALQVFALLLVLLPQLDNRSVYGFKVTGLLKSFAKAMEKEGGMSGKLCSAQLLEWIRAPVAVEAGPHLITAPEVTVARLFSKCFPEGRGLSLVEAVAICQRLTHTYKERHKQAVLTLPSARRAVSVHIDSVAEVLAGVLPALSYLECKLLVKLLLRTVPIGVGPRTVLQALGHPHDTFLDLQNDLSRLALSVVSHDHPPVLVCGVPFTPMTCNVTSSPYLLKWLFSKEDSVKNYLTPKEGKLVVHSTGNWYVPLKGSSSAMRKRFVDLESSAAVGTALRSKHMLVLREIKRSQALIKEEAASGYLLSYMLYMEGEGYVMLRGAAQPWQNAGIEFVDSTVEMEIPNAPLARNKSYSRAWLSQTTRWCFVPLVQHG